MNVSTYASLRGKGCIKHGMVMELGWMAIVNM